MSRAGSRQERQSEQRRSSRRTQAGSPDGLIPGFGPLQVQEQEQAPPPAPPQVGGPVDPPDEDAALLSSKAGTLLRSSGVMAAGTLASRLTGMIRTILLVAALGTGSLGDAYNYANGLPNTIYNLAIGGILTSVIVPLLVSAATRAGGEKNSDGGQEYDQRLFTLVTMVLLAVTVVATAAAAPIALLYDLRATGSERHLVEIFAYFMAPQIFFYGMTSLAAAILNARGRFGAPMWTPVVNNVVVIVVCVAFMLVAGVHRTASSITAAQVWVLGIGTTLGIVAQTAALVPALRGVGFAWRPRFDFARQEIAAIGRMSGWMFGYVATTQVSFYVTAAIASTADHWAEVHKYPVGVGFAAYSYAWMLFQLPYAVIAISVITALLPRMSANAALGRYDLLRSDFSAGVRLGSVIVAPAALVLAALGPSLAEVLLGWGNTSEQSARYLGLVFAVFSLGLVPYMLFQLLLRVFYSLHDSKTPALIGVATMIINVGASLIALALFPKTEIVAALGAGFGLGNAGGVVVAWRVLSRRLGGLAGRDIGTSLLRMHGAALPGAIFALAVAVTVSAVFGTGMLTAAAIVVFGGAGALALYWIVARALRISEVAELAAALAAKLGW
jgi:putative peptidoglycan lipid II flippase